MVALLLLVVVEVVVRCFSLRCFSLTSHSLFFRFAAADCSVWEETMLPSHDGFDDFVYAVIQFAYVACFSAVMPLTPLIVLMNTTIQIRLDAYKLCRARKRPLAQKAGGIGVWEHVLHIVTVLAVLTNCGLMAFTSNFVRSLIPLIGDWGLLLVIVGWEHLMLFVKYWMQCSFSAYPQSVKNDMKRERFNNSKRRASIMRAKKERRSGAHEGALQRRPKRHGGHGDSDGGESAMMLPTTIVEETADEGGERGEGIAAAEAAAAAANDSEVGEKRAVTTGDVDGINISGMLAKVGEGNRRVEEGSDGSGSDEDVSSPLLRRGAGGDRRMTLDKFCVEEEKVAGVEENIGRDGDIGGGREGERRVSLAPLRDNNKDDSEEMSVKSQLSPKGKENKIVSTSGGRSPSSSGGAVKNRFKRYVPPVAAGGEEAFKNAGIEQEEEEEEEEEEAYYDDYASDDLSIPPMGGDILRGEISPPTSDSDDDENDDDDASDEDRRRQSECFYEREKGGDGNGRHAGGARDRNYKDAGATSGANHREAGNVSAINPFKKYISESGGVPSRAGSVDEGNNVAKSASAVGEKKTAIAIKESEGRVNVGITKAKMSTTSYSGGGSVGSPLPTSSVSSSASAASASTKRSIRKAKRVAETMKVIGMANEALRGIKGKDNGIVRRRVGNSPRKIMSPFKKLE